MAVSRLTLRKDTLTELTTDDLKRVAAAGGLTGYYPSIFDPCDLTLTC